ncbi:hypothetical protein CLF_104892, partial [Clonorchis sinensis]
MPSVEIRVRFTSFVRAVCDSYHQAMKGYNECVVAKNTALYDMNPSFAVGPECISASQFGAFSLSRDPGQYRLLFTAIDGPQQMWAKRMPIECKTRYTVSQLQGLVAFAGQPDSIHKPMRPLQVNSRIRSYFNNLQGNVGRNSTRISPYRSQPDHRLLYPLYNRFLQTEIAVAPIPKEGDQDLDLKPFDQRLGRLLAAVYTVAFQYQFPEQRKLFDDVVPNNKPVPNPNRPHYRQLPLLLASPSGISAWNPIVYLVTCIGVNGFGLRLYHYLGVHMDSTGGLSVCTSGTCMDGNSKVSNNMSRGIELFE